METYFVLSLAHVMSNVDNFSAVVYSKSREKLEEWEKEQRADKPYSTEPMPDAFGNVHPFNLVYKEDSILKMYNPPDDYGAGIYEVNEPMGVLIT